MLVHAWERHAVRSPSYRPSPWRVGPVRWIYWLADIRVAAALCMGDGESVDGEGCQGKAELRRRAIAMRLRTTRDDRLRQGQAVVRAFAASGVAVRTGDVVAAYVSMGSEVDTRPLLSRLLATGCTVLVPRLGGGLDIGWSELESLKSLSNVGAGRPWEPSDGAVLPPGTLGRASLILVPALAVDARGTRWRVVRQGAGRSSAGDAGCRRVLALGEPCCRRRAGIAARIGPRCAG